ncbi:rhodanese family chromate resistance protein ChrE [Paraburkholderia fungorum]|uniref:rhodanese family chromate resistance protein ChrE n=1 Tax=Paraburkholderia fungorum TaxID=134537 RepID=UPI00160F101A|nr:rhodanese family chromate resistance protein ChrE [Paraburkholderia fungorum]MBB5547606.1 rhodanese-related sulfurtransferase [Paraburkholderia fungorum]
MEQTHRPTALSASELADAMQGNSSPQIIDVRPQPAFALSDRMIANAIRRNPEDIGRWMTELDVTRAVVVYCVHGHQVSQGCASQLQDAGFRAAYLEAGFEHWASEGHAVMTKP